MLLRRHNLNLLPILRELLHTRSVSRTAERVGLSQSAVSTALAKLREAFGDEILVPVGRTMELTHLGASLVEQVGRACGEIETLLQPQKFQPETQTRRFVIATADYISLLMAPRLAVLMAERAPLASVSFMDVGPNLTADMMGGKIDVAIMPDHAHRTLDAKLDRTLLFRDETVVIASRRLRPFKGHLTREIYCKAQHAMMQMVPGMDPRGTVAGLRDLGIEQHALVLVQQFSALPAIVEKSACLALLQRRLAERFSSHYDIELFRPPFTLPPLDISMFYAPATVRDEGHQWFRDLLTEAKPES